MGGGDVSTLESQLVVKCIAEHKGQFFYGLTTKAGEVRIRVTKAGKIFATVDGKQMRIL